MIPKIIHFCWLSEEEYPVKIQSCIETWKKIMPDYEFKLWDRQAFDIEKLSWTRQAYDKKKYAYAADYIRFYALYNYGGIYLDSDVEVLRRFDDLLDQDFFFGYEYTGNPEAAVVGAKKELKWIKCCMEWYENKDYNDYVKLNKCIIAPLILQKGFEDTYHIKLLDDNKFHKYHNGSIYPFVYFSPKNGFSGEILKNENTYTIHHFNSSWLDINTVSLKIRHRIHITLIKLLGKVTYNKLMYIIRKILHKT